jgi:hypothetical protein
MFSCSECSILHTCTEFDDCDHDENVNMAAAVQSELGSVLASVHHSTDERSCGEIRRKRRRNSQVRVALETAGRLIQEIFVSIIDVPGGAPHDFHPISNRCCCARSLATSFVLRTR